MNRTSSGVNWAAAGLGWIVAVAAGILLSSLLRLLYGLFAVPVAIEKSYSLTHCNLRRL